MLVLARYPVPQAMTPREAGWSVTGEDEPPECIASGQVSAFAPRGSYLPCPICGQYVRIIGDPPSVEPHYPPAPEAPTMSLGL